MRARVRYAVGASLRNRLYKSASNLISISAALVGCPSAYRTFHEPVRATGYQRLASAAAVVLQRGDLRIVCAEAQYGLNFIAAVIIEAAPNLDMATLHMKAREHAAKATRTDSERYISVNQMSAMKRPLRRKGEGWGVYSVTVPLCPHTHTPQSC